jgi:hypothetical protein
VAINIEIAGSDKNTNVAFSDPSSGIKNGTIVVTINKITGRSDAKILFVVPGSSSLDRSTEYVCEGEITMCFKRLARNGPATIMAGIDIIIP